MLQKVLIANRGEIAVRIIGTAKKLGIETVLVVSEADRNSLAAEMADEVALIGPPPAAESYLRIDRIIETAKRTGADSIHPGYGLLAENADFADRVRAAGIKFVGPPPAAMRGLGSKSAAKAIAIEAGIRVVPGYQGDQQDLRTLKSQARHLGYPLVIKAVAGGGGRGMRVVEREADFAAALESAQREAANAFGDARVMIEKLIEMARHVEVQVFGDAHGNVVHLYERDCTLQRRHQKVIEEAPAPGISPALREKITSAAVSLAKAVQYEGAGTVEFLIEGSALEADARWYFIEANTRLQVEHPVTEAITRLDLVEWQLRIAAGERLPLGQEQIAVSGHAIETRLCAEDPAKNFMPSTGKLVEFVMPTGPRIRVDTGVRAGDDVSPFYDSMIAKIIAHAPSREAAIARQLEALDGIHVAGPRTNAAFLRGLLMHGDVVKANMDTRLIGRDLVMLTKAASNGPAIAAGLEHMLKLIQHDIEAERLRNGGDPWNPWRSCDGFQLGGERRQKLTVLVDGIPTQCDVRWTEIGPTVCAPGDTSLARPSRHIRVADSGDTVFVQQDLQQTELRWPGYDVEKLDDGETESTVRVPINGRIAKVFVREGERIEKGARIAVIEAMKMEHMLVAPRAGTLVKLAVAAGEQVTQGALVASIVPDPAAPATNPSHSGGKSR
jgi:3-methylcrotonyl-CoA carboxylase alpha subunit